jgi:hypothetical protein
MKKLIKSIFPGISILILVFIILIIFRPFADSKDNNKLTEHSFAQDSGDYWLSVDLPDISNAKKKEYCKKTRQEGREYYIEKVQEAIDLSDRLENYILDWYYNGVNPIIPRELLSPWIDNKKTHTWTLLRPEEVNPESQWYYYPAREEPSLDNFCKLYMNNAATHVTYLKLLYIAPFDSQLLVEGEFPYCRFMDYQITEPFDPRFPVTTNSGVMEVPIVDVDIEPDPGSINPFRLGGDRNAKNRDYSLVFDLSRGNSVDLNPVMQNKYFRAPGNTRVGGPFRSTGPTGDGVIIPSTLWLRYYAPDKGPDGKMDSLAGVSIPKVLLKLKTGETFWIQTDFSLATAREIATSPGMKTAPEDPPEYIGPSLGWFKMFGHWLLFAEGRGVVMSYYNPKLEQFIKKQIRNEYRCFFNQGSDAPPPGNFTLSATDMPYNNYISRPFWLGENKVYVLTGKIPTTPKTRNGESIMESAQARYWSICHTSNGIKNKDGAAYHKLGYGCLMDDEIIVDENYNYIIVYSRPEDRPWNAKPECGVT